MKAIDVLVCFVFLVMLTLVIQLLEGPPGLCSHLPVGPARLQRLGPVHQIQVWKEEREGV